MGCDENESTPAEIFDFDAGRRRRARRITESEVHRQLSRLLAGDRRAAGWLYDTFAPALFRRLDQRYGHLEGLETNDLLHDAYIFFFQRDAKVLRDFMERVAREDQTPVRLERHLWDLACGVASNRRRAAALRDHRSLETSGCDRELEDDTQEKLLLDRDELARLDECLRERGTRLYLYYKLRFWDGYAPHEIAKMTGWPQKATYKLRQALKEAVRRCAARLGI